MKVYVLTDIEGAAGVASFVDDTYGDGRFYHRSRRFLTAEVNAAVEGLLEAGATEIVVLDGHGSGAVNPEELHPEALLIMGKRFPPDLGIDASYDALLFVGQHCMAQRPGNLAHSFSGRSVEGMWLNGKPIGEFGIWATFAGTFGVPTVMLSGDDVACEEAKELVPGIVTVVTKKAMSLNSAMSLHPVKARERIREGARRALEQVGSIPPVKLDGPFTLRIQYKRTELADGAEERGFTRLDPITVEAVADDFRTLCPPGRALTRT